MKALRPRLISFWQRLDQGIGEIRRTDRGFDATRFAGYAAMMFREVQSAGMARDASALRDRVTPAMYVELEARGERIVDATAAIAVARGPWTAVWAVAVKTLSRR